MVISPKLHVQQFTYKTKVNMYNMQENSTITRYYPDSNHDECNTSTNVTGKRTYFIKFHTNM
jgi:hypothetical protein